MSDGPLRGVRVVVTRPRAQAASLVEAIEARGGTAVEVPVIEIVDPPDGGAGLREGLGRLSAGDWLVLSSPNGATRVGAALAAAPLAAGVSVAAIGPGTRRRAEAIGLAVDLVPETSVAEGLVAALATPATSGRRVLLARAEVARSVLPDELRKAGWQVDDVAAYRTVAVEVPEEAKVSCRHADVVAFTSSSTVRHLVDGVGVENLPPVVACIGPATAATARELGLTVDIDSPVHTVEGLVEAMARDLPNRVLLRPEDAGARDSRWLLDRYFDEIDERFEEGLVRDGMVTTEVDEISPPRGLFLAARLGGEPVGCGVLKLVADDVADIKRMWVSPEVRGRGVGRAILRRLVAEARAGGLRRVQLETNRALTEAIALYHAEGFVEVEPFNAEPNAHHWFALELD